jgi:hypothetical protein
MKTRIVFTIMLLMLVAFVPAVSAQGNDYNVTAEKALEHANAKMVQFTATNTKGFENWTGASIDPNPLELYDINGQKLFYQFSVYINSNLTGKIDIGANKTLGQSVRLVGFNPEPFNAAEAMNKSTEIANKNYPNGEIISTKMIVYDYPEIGAMTTVKDKTTGVKHRIIVDVYTLDVIPDKPATETQRGVWSMYEEISKNQIDENLKKWQSSDELIKSIEQAAADKGVNISQPISEKNIEKLDNTTIATTTDQKCLVTPLDGTSSELVLSVPFDSQTTLYYCGPASAQMISSYYGVSHSQNYIYNMMGGSNSQGVTPQGEVNYYKSSNGLNKVHSSTTQTFSFNAAVAEIGNWRPFGSETYSHARVCCGYSNNGGIDEYLYIQDPYPPYIGQTYWEAYGNEYDRVYVRS